MKDRTFCTPSVPAGTEDAAAKRKEEELQREIEAIKKEYADKQAKKKEKSKDTGAKAEKDDQQKSDEKEKDDKVCVDARRLLSNVVWP